MNKRIKLTIGIGMTLLLLAALFATAALAQGPDDVCNGDMTHGMPHSGASAGVGDCYDGTGGHDDMMGGFGGMMNGLRSMMQGWLTGRTAGGSTGTMPFGRGMMNHFANGIDGMQHHGMGGMMGGLSDMQHHGMGGMMSGFGDATGCPGAAGTWSNPGNAEPITMDRAVEAAQNFLTPYDNPDLTVAEVMEFENNFYAIIMEKSTGMGAFELLVNRYTGAVTPEPGPNMMWNTTYGHMAGQGGMMGGMRGHVWNQPTGPMSVTVAQARTAAQQWLDTNQPSATLPDDEMQFPGYYTMDFLKDGEPAGMLSVNGYTGQVWYHTWHGEFISEQEF